MTQDLPIEGHASLFWTRDLNDDVAAAGAFAASLARTGPAGVKMLHQHDDAEPVGVWDEIEEDATGLYVRGRILRATPRGRLVAALVEAGAPGRPVDRLPRRQGPTGRHRAAAGADPDRAVGGVDRHFSNATGGSAESCLMPKMFAV